MAAYGIGAAAGGFADGYLKGRMAREQINSNKMEKTLNEQRLKEGERTARENERNEAAREKLKGDMSALDGEHAEGAGGFSTFMPPRMGMQGHETFDLETAVAEKPAKSPWTGGAAYKDPAGAQTFYDGRMSNAYKEYFAAIGQPEKAMVVDSTISDMSERKIGLRVKGAAAGLLVGAPGSIERLGGVASYLGYGDVDPKSGSFDPKTQTWSGVKITQDGKTRNIDITPNDVMAIANYGDPAKAFEALMDKQFKDETLKNQKLGLANDATRLDNDGKRIDIAAANSEAEAEDRRKGREMERDRGNVELLHKIISNSFNPPIKPDAGVYKLAPVDEAAQETIKAYDASVVEYEDRIEGTNRLVDGAQNLMTLNPGLTPQDAAFIMQKNVRFRPRRGPDGKLYIEYRSQKLRAE